MLNEAMGVWGFLAGVFGIPDEPSDYVALSAVFFGYIQFPWVNFIVLVE